ncbi:MAG: hypothetical protein M0R80_04385 [Proteobacteria bacterium]|jgi:hypothetical protein|nr:hypothetical protein [Pseudomonadota bacterium]
MTNTFYLNSLELSPVNDIYITDAVQFDPSSSFETNSYWHGTKVTVLDIQPKSTKITLKGNCTTETALRLLAHYHITNYNWNDDTESVYLIKDLSVRWKIKSFDFSYEHSHPGMPYPFLINITLNEIGAEGYVQTAKTGSTNSSPVAVTSILNTGDQITLYDLIKITGGYYSGSNLMGSNVSQYTIGYDLNVADVLLDTAYFEFYNDYTAKHTYIDSFATSDGFTRNKESSTNVTFSTNHLVIANSGSLKYRFRLTHPLLQDPVLTLTTATVIGNPVLEVSSDNTNWWECEKSITAGSQIDYNLTKLAGYSDFYFRITAGASDSLNLYYMKLISWHNYSGQKPIPYLRSASTAERLDLSFTAGSLTYDIRYRDKWSV